MENPSELMMYLRAMDPAAISILLESADLLFTATIFERLMISAAVVQKSGLSIKEDQGRFKTSTPLDSVWKDREVSKIKRGLPGFVNGSRTSALADTGAAQNIVSAAFVQEKGLSIKEDQRRFRLGNSKIAQSVGKTHSGVHVD